MKVLLTGASGQLGQALIASTLPELELIPTNRQGGSGLLPLDLADADACRAAVQQHRPDWVLNPGAYTAVDPLGVYGATKAAGEAAALQLPGARVLRSSWVYGPVGHNFCRTMLRLHRERAAAGQPLAVVADQVGCPTSTLTLAVACWRAIGVGLESAGAAPLPQILHCSDAGAASWYDFAVAIGELGVVAGLLERAARVLPISTADYPTPARRPSYSLLDCSASRVALGLVPQHWRAALAQVLSDLSPSLDPSRRVA